MKNLRVASNKQRGDTIVEVLLATVILSVILAGAFTLSNRANRIGQAALERTEATNKIQEYAEILREIRSADGAVWRQIRSRSGTTSPAYDASGAPRCQTTNAGALYIDIPAIKANPSLIHNGTEIIKDFNMDNSDFSAVEDAYTDDLFAVWVEPVTITNSAGASLVADMHIRACWEGIGSDPVQHNGAILRLYTGVDN